MNVFERFLRLFRKRPPKTNSIPSNPPLEHIPAVRRMLRFMKEHARLLLRILWIAGLVLCAVRWVTGRGLLGGFLSVRFRFAGFPELGRMISQDMQPVIQAIAHGRLMWPPRFELLGRLFSVQGPDWMYTWTFLLLCGIWMLRVVVRRQVLGRPSAIPLLGEMAVMIPLFALIQNINASFSRNMFWVPVWSMAQLAALVVPLTGLIQLIILRKQRQDIAVGNLIAGLILEALLFTAGFCLCY